MRPLLFLLALTAPAALAQFTLQTSGTTASLRGIVNVGGPPGKEVAWASGTGGTVLRTVDGGDHWTTCATPPGAEKLDFRGVQAFDAQTAVVMSSGKGDQSRIYKTVDGCKTWQPPATNPDADGFWDAMLFLNEEHGLLLGDPSSATGVQNPGDLRLRVTANGGKTWGPVTSPMPQSQLQARPHEAFFAASNASMTVREGFFWFATSASRVVRRQLFAGTTPPRFFFESTYCAGAVDAWSHECGQPWTDLASAEAPVAHGNASSGIFAIHFRTARVGTVVGGDYQAPSASDSTAAFSTDGGTTWLASDSQPHGYRSSVAYDAAHKTWITTGPNGTDTSTDDGRNWHPLLPNATKGDAADADKQWNALSLPFVVGPKGRVGRLRMDALPASRQR